MCGIIGTSGSFDPNMLSASLAVIAHRGPDDSGIFVDEQLGVGLGYVRLLILDLLPICHQAYI